MPDNNNNVRTLDVDPEVLAKMFETYGKLYGNNLISYGMEYYQCNEDIDSIKMVVAGLMNKLNLPYTAIYTRPLMPKFDFIGYEDKLCSDNSWFVQFNRNYDTFGQSIYKTDPKQSKMEYKCMVITGIEYNPEVTPVDEITLWRTGTKLIDRYVFSHIGYDTDIIFKTPIIIGLGKFDEHFDVKATLIEHADIMKRSVLKLKGFVAEPLSTPTSTSK